MYNDIIILTHGTCINMLYVLELIQIKNYVSKFESKNGNELQILLRGFDTPKAQFSIVRRVVKILHQK